MKSQSRPGVRRWMPSGTMTDRPTGAKPSNAARARRAAQRRQDVGGKVALDDVSLSLASTFVLASLGAAFSNPAPDREDGSALVAGAPAIVGRSATAANHPVVLSTERPVSDVQWLALPGP